LQTTRSTPFRLISLQCSQITLTDALTFMGYILKLFIVEEKNNCPNFSLGDHETMKNKPQDTP
jgi:hypothetical protein